MSLITINGVVYPDPDTYKVDIEPIGSWERNANGLLVGDLIGFKTKLNMTWGGLSGSFYQQLLSGMSPFFLTIVYWDPRVNDYSTGTFYASPRSGDLALHDGAASHWRNVSINLIER